MKMPKKIITLKTATSGRNPIDAPCKQNHYLRMFPDAGFHLLSMHANAQTRIVLYLLRNMDADNMVCCTYAAIESGCDITSRKAISKVLKDLFESNAIVMVQQSVYMVNPVIMMKGNESRFEQLFRTYQEIRLKSRKNVG